MNVLSSYRPFFIALAVSFFSAACQPGMTVPGVFNATPTSEKSDKAPAEDTTAISEETFAGTPPPAGSPPPAATPLPTFRETGDGDSTPPSAPEAMARRIDGSAAGDGVTPTPVYATRESTDGVVSSPVIREAVDTPFDNLRVVYWPSSERVAWSNAEEFFAKLAAGQITDDIADGAKVMHWSIIVFPPLEDDPPLIVAREEDVMDNGLVQEPGYYLFFFTADGLLWNMGPDSMDVTSAAQLKSLVRLDQTDPEGHPFRIRFMGDRWIMPRIIVPVDRSLLVPRSRLLPGQTPELLPTIRDIVP